MIAVRGHRDIEQEREAASRHKTPAARVACDEAESARRFETDRDRMLESSIRICVGLFPFAVDDMARDERFDAGVDVLDASLEDKYAACSRWAPIAVEKERDKRLRRIAQLEAVCGGEK